MALDFLLNLFKKDNFEYYIQIAQESIKLKDFTLAIEKLNKAISKKHNSAKAYNLRGYAKRWLQNYEEAIKDYKIALNIDPNFADAYYNMGNAYGMLGKYELAIECFTSSINLNPLHAESYCFRGVALRYLNKLDEAIKDFNKAISIDKNLGVAYTQRGFVYKLREELEEMFKDLKVGIELGENDSLTYFYMGYYYYIKENFYISKEFIEKSLKINSELPESYYYLGLIYDKIDKLDEAKEMMNLCIKLDPNHHLAYYYRAIYNLYTNHKAAIADFYKAIEIYPSNLIYYTTLAQLYIKVEDFLEATALLNKALFYFNDSYYIYYLLAQCYFCLDNLQKARYCIEKSLNLSDTAAEGQLLLFIDILHEMKLYNEEINHLNKAILHFPNNNKFILKKAVALNMINNHIEAIKIFNQYETINNQDVFLYIHRSFAYLMCKNNKKAYEDIIKAAELDFEIIKRYKTNMEESLFRDLYYVSQFTQNIKNNLNVANNYYERGNIKLVHKCYSEAIKDYNLALNFDKSHFFALNNASNAYLHSGLYLNALEYVNKAIELKPLETRPYYNRGCIYIELNKYEEALDDLLVAIKDSSNQSEVYERLANVYSEINDNEHALNYYNMALKYSDSPYYVFQRGLLFQKLNLLNDAINDFSTAIFRDHSFAEAYLKRGSVKFELGEKISGLDDIKFALSLGNLEAKELYNEFSKLI
jgi:tetratricopeptide (TPR) repeat protein